MRLLYLALLLLPCSSGQIRINAGGPAVTDSAGVSWSADQYFSAASASNLTTSETIPAGLPAFLSTKRYGTFSYTIPVPDGAYTVSLYFCDMTSTAAGQRVFTVTANGASVLGNYDIVQDVGRAALAKKTFPVTVAGGGLKLGFSYSLKSALVNAIEVIPVPVAPPPPSGPLMTSQLGDMQVTRGPGENVLTIGANCSDVTPCNVLQGSVTSSFVHPLTVTLNGGTGTAAIYIDGESRVPMVVSDTLTLACSDGCLTGAGTVFPIGSVALAQWPAANGKWDPKGKDLRSFIGHPITWFIAGPGIQMSETPDTLTIGLAPSLVSAFSWLSPLNPTGGPVLAGSSFTLGTANHKVPGPCTVLSVTLFSPLFDASTPKWSYNPAACDVTIGPAGADLGDFRVSIVLSLGGPQLLALERCSGSAPGWDCAGMLRANILLADGSPLVMYGVPLPADAPPANPLAVWSPFK